MMTISEILKPCASGEPSPPSRIQSFPGPCRCLSFSSARSLMRTGSHGCLRTAIPNPSSRGEAARPFLSRCTRTVRGCDGVRPDMKDGPSERVEPHVETSGFVNGPYGYKVREGDTLTSIANKCKVSLQSMAILNEIDDINYVPAGKLLLIPHDETRSSEVVSCDSHHSNLVDLQTGESKSIVQVKGPFALAPVSLAPFFQTRHVKLALSFLLLLAVFGLVRRYISGIGPKRHDEPLQFQIEEVEGTRHEMKVRRWQGILDDDRRVHEADGDLSADGRAALDTEEENLRQTYAQLESAYVKFLADSGLSKTGYWRGGVPPALEEK